MITASGVGSGIDVDGIVTQLMELEREPINRLEARQQKMDVQLSAFASARSLISDLAKAAGTLGDGGSFAPFLAESTDETVLTATAGSKASEGRHDIEVLSLATAHRVASAGYPSADESVGAGTWNFSSGDSTFEIELADGEDSLAALRDAINSSADNNSIVASILTVDDGTRLVLTARETGSANEITATRTYQTGGLFGGTTTENPFEEMTAAQDASLLVDGFEVTRSSNMISDVIEGVTLELAGLGTASLNTSRNTEAMNENLNAFVEKYNALQSELEKLGESSLQGDRLPRDVQTALSRAFSSDIDLGDGRAFAPVELGFRFDRYGVLSIDTEELNTRQAEGFDALVSAFSRPNDGFASRLEEMLQGFTGAGGRIDAREEGVKSQRDSIDDTIERQEYRMESIEARYRRQFATMDSLIGSLQTTSSFLSDRLGA